MATEIVEMLKATGLQVWMRSPKSEYCYCTDGVNICYVQWSGGRTFVSTVHMANKYTGTGFQLFDSITLENIRKAMETDAPEWASQSDRQSVKKYKDWNSFHKENSFNAKMYQA